MHMNQNKVCAKQEKIAVKRGKTCVKYEPSHTKQENAGPYQMYYINFSGYFQIQSILLHYMIIQAAGYEPHILGV